MIGNAAVAGLVSGQHTAPVVQRMPRGKIFEACATAMEIDLSQERKTWLWEQLLTLANGKSKLDKLDAAGIQKLLADNGITREVLEREVPIASPAGATPAPDYNDESQAMVEAAERTWREVDAQLPQVTRVTFNVPGLGQGTAALLRAARSANPGMLSWFSHGYEDRASVDLATERRYGFAVDVEKSLNRLAPADAFASLPAAFVAAAPAPLRRAPSMFVRPHTASELKPEIDRLVRVTQHSDVAVLLDFHWAAEVDQKFSQGRRSETPPLHAIIEGTPAFNAYGSLLLFACRTPWSVNVAVQGSGPLKEAMIAELKAKGQNDADARREAQERYEATPQPGKVFF
jgi:hypothetical protein